MKHLNIVWEEKSQGKAIYLASLLLLCSIKMPRSISRLCAKIISFVCGDDDDGDDDDDDDDD